MPALYFLGLYAQLLHDAAIHKGEQQAFLLRLRNSVVLFCGSKLFGVYGLALATTLTSILTVIITKFYCKNYIDHHKQDFVSLCIKAIVVWLECVVLKIILSDASMLMRIITIMLSAGIALIIFNFDKIMKEVVKK